MYEFDKVNAILASAGAKASPASVQLPAPVFPAWYDAGTKVWFGETDLKTLPKSDKAALVQCSMLVQYSATDRFVCRRCGVKIEKSRLQLCYPHRPRSCEPPLNVYLHPECYAPEVFGVKEKELRLRLFGFEALSNTERARLWRAMRSGGRAAASGGCKGGPSDRDLSSGSVVPSAEVEPVQAPRELVKPLLRFQQEGLAWMCRQEASDVRGGVLADEMGMGKTLQAISLLLARPLKGPCLVVCPMAAVHQWVSEIQRFTAPGALRPLVYHGEFRASVVPQFRRASVVITTYQTLEFEYRREADKQRLPCKHCGKLFLPERLSFHQRYFCGPDSVRTAKQARTDRKYREVAIKGLQTMGICQGSTSSSSSSSSSCRTSAITGICRDLEEEGTGLKCKLAATDMVELRGMCAARGLDTSGRKAELISRLMDLSLRGKAKERAKVKKAEAKAKAKAKAEARAKAKAKPKLELVETRVKESSRYGTSKYHGVAFVPRLGKWQAYFDHRYLGVYPSERKAAEAVAEARAGGSPSGPTSRKAKAAARPPRAPGGKRKRVERGADDGAAPAAPAGTWEGVPVDLSGSPLHCCRWSRIILDEGHRIKGRTNSTALAAYALPSAGFKWCLTGTPMQNNIGELYSIVRFLRMRPFAFYYCHKAGCKCECARFMQDRYCPNCGHIRFMHYSYFKMKVSKPIVKFGFVGAGRAALQTLQEDILGKIMLRRTKRERKEELKLPPIKVTIRKDYLSKEEQDFYSSLHMQSAVQFETYVRAGTVLHNYAHLFDLLTSLRRAVDHPYLIVHGSGAATSRIPGGSRLQVETADVCGLCQDAVGEDGEEEGKRISRCGHAFHDDCIRAYLEDAPELPSGGVGCPVCFTRLSVDLQERARDSDEEAGEGEGEGEDEGEGEGKGEGEGEGEGKGDAPAEAGCQAPVAAAVPPKGLRARARGGAAVAAAAVAVPAAAPAAAAAAAPAQGRTAKLRKGNIMQKVRPADFRSSTKIEALVEEVSKMIEGDASAKGLVFSQFGAMLELVEFRLKSAGISCVVFRGGMTMQARNDALAAFGTDPTLRVLILGLKAGGEGLNLQVANHVFLLDPWWNPACELQAIQRAHRIGQTREVHALRFVAGGTIEERIVQLQEKKQLVFDACIDASEGSMAKLTDQDLRFLFQH